jgi:hypothetical protein
MQTLTPDLASRYALVALSNILTEYPNALGHYVRGPQDIATPRALHPAFYGSYDWHSCVHMHWTLVRLVRLHRNLPEVELAMRALATNLMPEKIEKELAYFSAPGRQSWERPYGWAWLLRLAHELELLAPSEPDARGWADALQPLAYEIGQRLRQHLPELSYPNRGGAHGNTAFALLLAYDWATRMGEQLLAQLIRERAGFWFGQDRDYPARYEPGGDDFLSGGLTEAVLMQRVLSPLAFSVWWHEFCPKTTDLAAWMRPAQVTDRSDAKIAHLDGLNLSRAWCMRRLLPFVPARLAGQFKKVIDSHLNASLPHAGIGEYVGTHWLASFAVLALTD